MTFCGPHFALRDTKVPNHPWFHQLEFEPIPEMQRLLRPMASQCLRRSVLLNVWVHA